MTNGLNKFEIELDNSQATFAPGELISGQVILDLSKKKSLRALKLKFKGKCEVRWSESRHSRKNSRRTHYTADEIYFHDDIYLYGRQDASDTIEIESGRHVFPFSYTLPHNIPSSFEHSIGHVRYSMKAIFDRPWKFDYESIKPFTVVTPFQLDESGHEMLGLDDHVENDFCCFPILCINRGNMSLDIRLPKTGYAIGEAIEVIINMDNKSQSVDVTRVKLKLIQKKKFHAEFPYGKTKSKSDVVQKSTKYGPFLKKSEVIVGLQVPSVPLSDLTHCKFIDIMYKLDVSVRVNGLHCPMNRSYDILIGSRMAATQRIQPPQITPFISHYPTPFTTPSAPIDSFPAQNPSVPYPMPFPTMPQNTEKRHDNTSVPYPPYPVPGTMTYPPEQPGTACPYPAASGYQPPPNIGFVSPSSSTGPFDLPPPPSYESVMSDDLRK